MGADQSVYRDIAAIFGEIPGFTFFDRTYALQNPFGLFPKNEYVATIDLGAHLKLSHEINYGMFFSMLTEANLQPNYRYNPLGAEFFAHKKTVDVFHSLEYSFEFFSFVPGLFQPQNDPLRFLDLMTQAYLAKNYRSIAFYANFHAKSNNQDVHSIIALATCFRDFYKDLKRNSN
ncbi:MAG: hypothetical protein NDI94_01680 [Candidatus Woesearchaeota archaeon]|nr:hypothetical protein [Candidatus Woesearchaeota archaeon]